MSKKSKIVIIIVSIILLVTVFAGVLIWYINKWNNEKELNTPEEISKKYFEYINEGKYEQAYNFLTPEGKNIISKENFEEIYKNFFESIKCEAIQTCNIEIEKLDLYDSKAKYLNKIRSAYGEFEYENTLKLKKLDDKKYYVDWNYSTIYPGYESGYQIKVNVEEAKRGSLIDRNGSLLAGTGYISSIGVVPGWMDENTKVNDIKKISEILGISVETINKKMSASYVKPDTFVELDTVSKQDYTLLGQLREIKGIKIKDVESRVYPLGEKAAHVTGYVQKASSEDIKANKKYTENTLVGKTGLEAAYNERLSGKNGYEILLVDENKKTKASIFKCEKEDGENITLTIDANIQSSVYDIYKGDNSATVVMYPGTGEIAALVSTPSYDPNKFVIGMTNKEWSDLNSNPNNPLYTRFLKRYPPGSTFKPIIGAIALETGTINPYDEYEKSGTSWQNNSSWGSYKITTLKEYDEPATLQNALINSDNIFFAKTAIKIGAKKLEESLKNLGFETDFEFDMTTKNSQISNEGKFINEIQLADSGYGQGQILVNPIHFAALYSMFANGGNIVKPYIEMAEETETSFIKEHAISKDVAETIKEDMIQTIENPEGTGHAAKIEGIKLAGKTGTAETKSTKEEEFAKEIGWFNVFVDDSKSKKQYLIISMIEDVENKGGSQYVINKVKQILK